MPHLQRRVVCKYPWAEESLQDKTWAGIVYTRSVHCQVWHRRGMSISTLKVQDVSEVPTSFFEKRQRVLTSDMQLAKITTMDNELRRSTSPPTVDGQTEESRFYVYKKIVIGAFVKKLLLADEHTSHDGYQYSYKWKLFINGPPEVCTVFNGRTETSIYSFAR